jgi:hypothetical protein
MIILPPPIEDPNWREDFQRTRPMVRALRVAGSVLFLVFLAALCCACVRRGQVCIEASHGRVDPGWSRNDNVGASVCAEVEAP